MASSSSNISASKSSRDDDSILTRCAAGCRIMLVVGVPNDSEVAISRAATELVVVNAADKAALFNATYNTASWCIVLILYDSSLDGSM